MSQIITVTVANNRKHLENCVFDKDIKHILKKLLNEENGELFSLTAINISTNEIIIDYCYNKEAYYKVWDNFCEKVLDKSKEWGQSSDIDFVFYSKESHETDFETNIIKIPPYFENNRYVWFSGSITNLEEIKKTLNKKIEGETQVIAYYDELLKENIIINGVFDAVVYDFNKKTIEWLHNGSGCWNFPYKCGYDYNLYWKGTTENLQKLVSLHKNILKSDNSASYYYEVMTRKKIYNKKNYHRYYIAFSGGVTSIFSSYVKIKNGIIKIDNNLNLWYRPYSIKSDHNNIFIYFDYGSKASKQEIAALKKFYNLVKNEFPYNKFEYKIVDIKNLFNKFNKNIYNEELNIRNDNGFFPFCNTEIIMLLSAMIDKELEKEVEKELFDPYIIFGMNLTEISLNVENNSAWLQSIESTIIYSSNKYKNIEIITPFKHLSKSNMIVFMIKKYGYDKTKELLDIAFSCVNPDENGEPCGKCLKCISRKNSFEQAIKRIKKNFFKK